MRPRTPALLIFDAIMVSFTLRGLLLTPRSFSTHWNYESLVQEASQNHVGELEGVQALSLWSAGLCVDLKVAVSPSGTQFYD